MEHPEVTDAVAISKALHELRLDRCETVPLRRAHRRTPKRPKTHLLTLWAQRAINERITMQINGGNAEDMRITPSPPSRARV